MEAKPDQNRSLVGRKIRSYREVIESLLRGSTSIEAKSDCYMSNI